MDYTRLSSDGSLLERNPQGFLSQHSNKVYPMFVFVEGITPQNYACEGVFTPAGSTSSVTLNFPMTPFEVDGEVELGYYLLLPDTVTQIAGSMSVNYVFRNSSGVVVFSQTVSVYVNAAGGVEWDTPIAKAQYQEIVTYLTHLQGLWHDETSGRESADSALSGRMDAAETDIQNDKNEEATHHHIKTDGSGYAVQEFPSNENPGQSTSEERLMNHADGVAVNSSLTQLNASINAMLLLRTQEGTRIDKIVDGSTKVGASSNADTAQNDSNGDTINAAQYGKSLLFSYNAANGVITIKLVNQAGTVIDTKTVDLPAELVFIDQGYDANTHSLWFKPANGGNNIVIPLSDLIDTYTAGTTATCSVSIDNHVISVSILDGSITLAKMSTALQNTINGWATAESNRVTSENGRVSAEAQRVLNENARLAAPHLFIDTDSYISINYGSGNDVTID